MTAKACPQCKVRYPGSATFCFLDGAALIEAGDPMVGRTIAGRYVIEGQLGEGGMATVYRAKHTLVDRPCAVKFMNPIFASDPTTRERFRREARSAQALAHPNVIEIFDQGVTEEGRDYIVMELLSGQTLGALIDRGPVPPARAVPILIQMARGIARAHDLGVVHRDLKPDNIYLCPRADRGDLVKILDFGIARQNTDTRLTGAGELFGTPQYLAPERIMQGETGPSVDLYALGVIFFEVLTGRLPIEASDATMFLVRHVKDKPPRAKSYVSSLPDALDSLVAQLLEKDPHARPVDAHRIEKDLVEIARSLDVQVPVEVEQDPASSRPPARTLPSVGAEQWPNRVELFQQMLALTFHGNPPGDLAKNLDELRALVRELIEVRTASVDEQREIEQIDARGRDGRQRFGFAVDALGLDTSKSKEDARLARTVYEGLAAETHQALDVYKVALKEQIFLEGRSAQAEPYAQLAAAYRASADAVDAWREARQRENAAKTRLADRDRVATDLEFQINALRTALATHEQGIDKDREAASKRSIELSSRAEAIESKLLQLATRFCEPLRSRADLGPLFMKLESQAAPSN
ncbi:MAG: serine/threonine-protein kinase [Polyangiaceae bacterium]